MKTANDWHFVYMAKNAAKRDNAGAVCNSGMGIFFFGGGFHQRVSSIKVLFNQRLSSIKGCLPLKGHLPSKVVFHQMLSSTKGWLPSKIVFHQRSSSIKGHFYKKLSSIKVHFPSKVILHQRLSCIKGHLQSSVVFHKRMSSIKGCLS